MTPSTTSLLKTSTIPGMSGNTDLYFMGYYVPRRFSLDDPVSDSILQVKNNDSSWTNAWAKLMFENLPSDIAPDAIVRALGSTETITNSHHYMDSIGLALVQKWPSAEYTPEALSKTRSTLPLKHLGRQARINEISNCYQFTLPASISRDDPTILILDDIVTTGSTMSEIVRAIQEACPDANVVCTSFSMTYSGAEDVRHDNMLLLSRLINFAKGAPITPIPTSLTIAAPPVLSTEDKERILADLQSGKSRIELRYKYNLAMQDLGALIREFKESSDLPEDIKVPPFPHVHFDAQSGGWMPDFGYTWIDPDDKSFLGVRLNPPSDHLVLSPKGTGRWIPEVGYRWQSDDPNDLSVIPKVYRKSKRNDDK